MYYAWSKNYFPLDAEVNDIKNFPDNKDIWMFGYGYITPNLSCTRKPMRGKIKNSKIKNVIVVEAMALVLSGDLDKLEAEIEREEQDV